VEAGARLISDPLIDIFTAAGNPDQVAERLSLYAAAGIHGLLAWHVLGPDRKLALHLLADEVLPSVV
jgi:hypothetical protein